MLKFDSVLLFWLTLGWMDGYMVLLYWIVIIFLGCRLSEEMVHQSSRKRIVVVLYITSFAFL